MEWIPVCENRARRSSGDSNGNLLSTASFMVPRRNYYDNRRTTSQLCYGCKYVLLICPLILLDYSYENLSTKSPDRQFTPKSITIPPALPKPGTIRPGYLGPPFSTLVFEVSHQNESWSKLLQDAITKAFSVNTSRSA